MRVLALSLSAILLTGCFSSIGGVDPIERSVVTEDRVVYPDLPPIEIPEDIGLLPFSFSIPTDKDGDEVLGGNSNRCLAQDDWQTWQLNHVKTKAYIARLIARIEEVNKQRSEWRARNAIQEVSTEQ